MPEVQREVTMGSCKGLQQWMSHGNIYGCETLEDERIEWQEEHTRHHSMAQRTGGKGQGQNVGRVNGRVPSYRSMDGASQAEDGRTGKVGRQSQSPLTITMSQKLITFCRRRGDSVDGGGRGGKTCRKPHLER